MGGRTTGPKLIIFVMGSIGYSEMRCAHQVRYSDMASLRVASPWMFSFPFKPSPPGFFKLPHSLMRLTNTPPWISGSLTFPTKNINSTQYHVIMRICTCYLLISFKNASVSLTNTILMIFLEKEWICMIWKQLCAAGETISPRIVELILDFKDFEEKILYPPPLFFSAPPPMKSSPP